MYGCTDSTACNYDPVAEIDDGSCGVVDVCGICDGGGSSCTGCTDPIACNYMAAAIYDDGSCAYPPAGFDCNCASDINVVASLTASQSAETSLEATGALTTIDLTLYLQTLVEEVVGLAIFLLNWSIQMDNVSL